MKRSYHIEKFSFPLLFSAGIAMLFTTYYISSNTKKHVDFNHSCRVISIYDNINSCKLDYTDQTLNVCDTAFSNLSFEKTTLRIKYANLDKCNQDFGSYCKFIQEGSIITPKGMAISHYKQKHHLVHAVFERNGELVYGDYTKAHNQTPDDNCRTRSSTGGGHSSSYAHTTGRSGFGSLGGAHGTGG